MSESLDINPSGSPVPSELHQLDQEMEKHLQTSAPELTPPATPAPEAAPATQPDTASTSEANPAPEPYAGRHRKPEEKPAYLSAGWVAERTFNQMDQRQADAEAAAKSAAINKTRIGLAALLLAGEQLKADAKAKKEADELKMLNEAHVMNKQFDKNKAAEQAAAQARQEKREKRNKRLLVGPKAAAYALAGVGLATYYSAKGVGIGAKAAYHGARKGSEAVARTAHSYRYSGTHRKASVPAKHSH